MGVSEAALRTERLDAGDQTYETELEAEMMALDGAVSLMAWAKSAANQIATLPADWQQTLRRRFAERRDELIAMAEAAE